MTKISSLTALTGASVDSAADLLPIVDMSETGTARNKKITIDEARIGLGLGTAASPQFAGLNLGHASDTTITRVSAGVVAIEGVNIVTTAGAITFAADISVPDEAYDATNWNGSLEVPTKNAIRDKIESLSIGGGIDVEDEGVSEATGATTLDFVGAGVTATDQGGGVVEINIPGGGGGSGALIGCQVITATGAGTYTPTGGTNSIVIEMVGGGGGGAGVPSSGANNGSRSGSGGGGAYLKKRLTANFSGASYSVGAKGTGGAAGTNAGNNGSNTTFTDTAGSPTVYTAGGGTGGGTSTATTPVQTGVPTAGGTATNGDINVPGGPSDGAMILITSGGGQSGRGGASHFSPGAIAVRVSTLNSSTAGNSAGGYGGGGSAGYCQGTGSAVAGGDGSDGILIMWEYS